MAEKDVKDELIDPAPVPTKAPEKPAVKPADTKVEDKKVTMGDVVKGIANIPKEGPGLTEAKSEPHTHLMVLLIIVIILGVVISFIKI